MEYRKYKENCIVRINKDEEGVVRGGHLVRCNISATSEIIIREIEGEVGRKLSSEIGLNLLDF